VFHTENYRGPLYIAKPGQIDTFYVAAESFLSEKEGKRRRNNQEKGTQ